MVKKLYDVMTDLKTKQNLCDKKGEKENMWKSFMINEYRMIYKKKRSKNLRTHSIDRMFS